MPQHWVWVLSPASYGPIWGQRALLGKLPRGRGQAVFLCPVLTTWPPRCSLECPGQGCSPGRHCPSALPCSLLTEQRERPPSQAASAADSHPQPPGLAWGEDTAWARSWPDAQGQPAERHSRSGQGNQAGHWHLGPTQSFPRLPQQLGAAPGSGSDGPVSQHASPDMSPSPHPASPSLCLSAVSPPAGGPPAHTLTTVSRRRQCAGGKAARTRLSSWRRRPPSPTGSGWAVRGRFVVCRASAAALTRCLVRVAQEGRDVISYRSGGWKSEIWV